MSEVSIAEKPFVRLVEVHFSPGQFEALGVQVEAIRSQARQLAVVEALVNRGWGFGEQDGDETVQNYFLPFAPKDEVAVVPYEADLKTECTAQITGYRATFVHGLYAVHMKLPKAVLNGFVDTKNQDQNGEDQRDFAAIIDLESPNQRARALVLSSFHGDRLSNGRDIYVANSMVQQLRSENQS